MGELDDDIARGCLPNGEPIEARWGTGEWSAQPEQQQEPDPWEFALSSARSEGYEAGYAKACNDGVDATHASGRREFSSSMVINMLRQLKSAHGGQENGKAE